MTLGAIQEDIALRWLTAAVSGVQKIQLFHAPSVTWQKVVGLCASGAKAEHSQRMES